MTETSWVCKELNPLYNNPKNNDIFSFKIKMIDQGEIKKKLFFRKAGSAAIQSTV